jgi:hypothetical protein
VFAPVPFLAALVEGRPLRSILRASGVAVLVFAALTAWWFEWVVVLSGRVYAVGLPGEDLGPLGLIVIGAAFALIAAGGSRATRWLGTARGRWKTSQIRGARLGVAVAVTVAWAIILGFGFAHSEVLASNPLISVGQITRYARDWGSNLAPIAVFGVIGIIGLLMFGPRNRRSALVALGLVGSISWALLVVATGEPPRDLVAQVALVDVLAASGWVVAVQRIATWSPQRRRPALAGVGVVVLVAALLAGHSIERLARSGLVAPGDTTRAAMTQAITAWLDAHVSSGSTVAFGAVEGEETAVILNGRYRLSELAPSLAVFDANGPDGLAPAGRPADVEWVAVDRHPREDAFYALSAASAQKTLADPQLRAVVYVTGLSTSSPSVLPLLFHSPGIRETARWIYPYGSGHLTVDVFSVDPALVNVPINRLYIQSDALSVILQRLTGRPDAATVAQQLLERVTLSPPSSLDVATLNQLRQLAGQP